MFYMKKKLGDWYSGPDCTYDDGNGWPVAVEGSFAGRATKPSMVQEVAAAIANLKGISVLEAEAILLKNAIDFYN